MGTYLPGTRKEGEEGDLLFIIIQYYGKEKEDIVVLLSFLLFPPDDILFIAPNKRYTCIINHCPTYQSIIIVSSYVLNTIIHNNQQQQCKQPTAIKVVEVRDHEEVIVLSSASYCTYQTIHNSSYSTYTCIIIDQYTNLLLLFCHTYQHTHILCGRTIRTVQQTITLCTTLFFHLFLLLMLIVIYDCVGMYDKTIITDWYIGQ